jgi:hypothetical protein
MVRQLFVGSYSGALGDSRPFLVQKQHLSYHTPHPAIDFVSFVSPGFSGIGGRPAKQFPLRLSFPLAPADAGLFLSVLGLMLSPFLALPFFHFRDDTLLYTRAIGCSPDVST